MGKPVFNVINALAFLGFGFLIYYSAFLTLRPLKFHWLIAIYLLLWCVPPFFGESYLWVSGASNYTYGPALVLLFLLPYRKHCVRQKAAKWVREVFAAAGMAALGLLAGWAGEAIGIAAACMVCLFVLKYILEKLPLRAWMFAGLFGSAVGMYLCISAPANNVRLSAASGWLGLGSLIFRLLKTRWTSSSISSRSCCLPFCSAYGASTGCGKPRVPEQRKRSCRFRSCMRPAR
jgi:hypothetical protein